ncbi:MAG TPA: hypothetical protein VJ739_10830, partial [Gemmataceae bacterium]|nr:hypothetical protein [Gemmataceae bacterium]
FVGAGWEKEPEGSYTGDLEYLSRVARKVATERQDLGSVNPVLAHAVEARMLGRPVLIDPLQVTPKASVSLLRAERDLREQVRRNCLKINAIRYAEQVRIDWRRGSLTDNGMNLPENLSLTECLLCRRIVVMARGGPDWQRQMAAQRREAERQAREAARLAKEREKLARERYLAARQQEADAKTSLIQAQVKTLDEILASVLTLAPLTFRGLMSVPKIAPFQPGTLGTPSSAPDWSTFAPIAPGALGRMFGGAGRHARQIAGAQAKHDAAMAEHLANESATASACGRQGRIRPGRCSRADQGCAA